jgi:actin-related protein
MDIGKLEEQAKSILNNLGRKYGCVVIIEEDKSYIIPVYGEMDLQFAFADNGVCGKDISTSINNLVIQKGYNDPFEESVLIDIRNSICFVSLDLDREFREYKKNHNKIAEREKNYYVNDETLIRFSHIERTIVCECLFRDPVIEGEKQSKRIKLPKIIVDTISKVHSEIQHSLYENIVLSGTVAALKGLKERLIKEITQQIPIEGNPPHRKFSKINIILNL